MSGVFKSVGKVFKKVAKVVKKVLPVALAVGAIIYTGGAALGVSGMAGGWGAAVSSLTSQMGATGVLGNVLTGAITQAGYGAAAGGLISKLSGGSFTKGAQTGALTGAVTGGVMGGLGMNTDPLNGMLGGDQAGAGAQAGASAPGGAPLGDVSAAPLDVGPLADGPGLELGPSGVQRMFPSAPSAASAPATAATASPAAPAAGNGMMGWLERNQTLAGNVIGGVGKGLLEGAQAEDIGEAALKKQREYLQWLKGNYGDVGPGLMAGGPSRASAAEGTRPTPSARFDPQSYRGQYVFDPQVGRIVFVENA